jgi:hypothetical protein
MNSLHFVRDPSKVYSAFKETENGELVALRPLKVYIPARFVQADMAKFETENTFVGISAFVVDDKYYAVSMMSNILKWHLMLALES